MKRFMFVLAVGLIFVVSLSSDAISRSHPFDFRYPHRDTDEHTWGGENEGSPGPLIKAAQPNPIVVGNFTPFEVFFNAILANWWVSKDTGTSEAPQNASNAVPIQQNSETTQLETSSNNKGN